MTFNVIMAFVGVLISLIGYDPGLDQVYARKIKEYEERALRHTEEYTNLRVDRAIASIISMVMFFGGIVITMYNAVVILTNW